MSNKFNLELTIEQLFLTKSSLLLVKDKRHQWHRVDIQNFLLKGGTGSAIRPENTKTINPKLGITSSGDLDKQKLLPEITALIDPDQFEIITQPKKGIVLLVSSGPWYTSSSAIAT